MNTMRLVVVLLAVISLLGLRTAYACAHMGNVPLAACCCKDGAAQCPKRHKCAEAEQGGESCCAAVVVAGAAGDEQATKATHADKLDTPPAASSWLSHDPDFSKPAPTPALLAHGAPDGSLTWLKTGRLRL